VTLAELLVVIVILGLIASVGVLTLRVPAAERPEGRIVRLLMAARGEAIRTRRPVVVRLEDSSGISLATALPDGSILSEARIRAILHLNTLTGTARVSSDTSGSHE